MLDEFPDVKGNLSLIYEPIGKICRILIYLNSNFIKSFWFYEMKISGLTLWKNIWQLSGNSSEKCPGGEIGRHYTPLFSTTLRKLWEFIWIGLDHSLSDQNLEICAVKIQMFFAQNTVCITITSNNIVLKISCLFIESARVGSLSVIFWASLFPKFRFLIVTGSVWNFSQPEWNYVAIFINNLIYK